MDLRRRPGRSLRPLARLARDRRGATVVEYGLILALIVLAIMSALQNVATVTVGMWNNINTKVSQAR